MFRRAASMLDFAPREGDQVEVRGRLAVYEPRGDLQLVVENLSRAGQGALFEQFLQRKARLEAEGLFDPARKRALPVMPRTIGVVTSLGAAALHDVATALRRRVPHLSVVLAPSAVQGANAPAELVRALESLYALQPAVDAILLVRGGGSIEDLWAFNDETLARTIARSPVPVVSGVGHDGFHDRRFRCRSASADAHGGGRADRCTARCLAECAVVAGGPADGRRWQPAGHAVAAARSGGKSTRAPIECRGTAALVACA